MASELADYGDASNNLVINNSAQYIELYHDASNNTLINNTATGIYGIHVGNQASNNVFQCACRLTCPPLRTLSPPPLLPQTQTTLLLT